MCSMVLVGHTCLLSYTSYLESESTGILLIVYLECKYRKVYKVGFLREAGTMFLIIHQRNYLLPPLDLMVMHYML